VTDRIAERARGRRAREATGAEELRFGDLRRRDAEEANHLVIATVRIGIPANLWLGRFTRRHPSLSVEIMNRSGVTPELSVSDYWISGGPPGGWTREIAAFPDVRSVDSLAELAGGCIYRVTFENPPIVYLYRKLGVPLQFPQRARAGQMFWEVAARDNDFRRILAYARSVDRSAAILSIRRRPLRSHLPELTDAQHALLTTAMAEGYFAVPRAITLTGLASKLGRSKSSISESLALIEKKILESAMRAPAALA